MMRTSSRRQAGLSIIELMIALLLGLLLMGGVIQIFLSSRQTYQTNTALSQVQESGRFALEFIAFDLRNAGYRGECLSKLNDLTPTSLTSGNDDRYVLGSGLKGWNDSSPGTLPDWLDTTYNARTSGTDVILLKHAANPVVKALPDNAAATNGSLTTGTTDSGARKGDLIIVADPVACDFFINQSDTGKSVSLKEGLNFSRAYNKTAQALNYQSTLYYLKNDTTTGVPSLWRTRYTSNAGSTPVEIAEELVSGIQDLQFQYALGNANGQITGNYLDANDSSLTNNWQSVVSVRINLLAVSRQKMQSRLTRLCHSWAATEPLTMAVLPRSSPLPSGFATICHEQAPRPAKWRGTHRYPDHAAAHDPARHRKHEGHRPAGADGGQLAR